MFPADYSILQFVIVMLALLLAIALVKKRSAPVEPTKRETVRRVAPSKPAFDVWSPVPYEPEALSGKLAPELIKPPVRAKTWRAHDEVPVAEQERISAKVQEQLALLKQPRTTQPCVKEVHLSHTEFGELFPNA